MDLDIICSAKDIKHLKNLIFSFYNSSLEINREDVKSLTWDEQEMFLKATVKHSLLKKYPVNNKFTTLYLKTMLSILEEGSDVHDDLYTYICNSMNNERLNQSFHYRHYIINNHMNKLVTMKETKNLVVNGTTGMRTWEAAIVLADWAISNCHLLNEKNVLELGSGIGFTGISIVKLCNVKSIYMTDCHQDVLDTMCENIEVNFPNLNKSINGKITSYLTNNKIGVMKLDWNTFTTLPSNIIPDIVIGADIVYDPSILPSLFAVFEKLYQINNNLDIYIASIIRNDATLDQFLEELKKMEYYVKILKHEHPMHVHWNENIKKNIVYIKKEKID